jgi:hypothetical protein
MKKFLIISIILYGLLPASNADLSCVTAQNTYSIDQKKKKRKVRRTRHERIEDRAVRKAVRKKEKLKAQHERQHKRDLKKYKKKVSGSGTDLVTDNKVYRRMKKSEREARKNSSRKKPFWNKLFNKNKKP